ncbi:MAG: hypothetical protein L0206_01000 [Actinobacteria bacterium]|nr:hypothetical protein [Actinomycetota bacterium]
MTVLQSWAPERRVSDVVIIRFALSFAVLSTAGVVALGVPLSLIVAAGVVGCVFSVVAEVRRIRREEGW